MRGEKPEEYSLYCEVFRHSSRRQIGREVRSKWVGQSTSPIDEGLRFWQGGAGGVVVLGSFEAYAEQLPLGTHAPAIPVSVMFRIRSTDPGDRGAWAAAQAVDTLYSVRAIYGNGRASGWSTVVRAGREPWPVF